jgi:hypothetical protein
MYEGKTHNYYWLEGSEFSLHELVTRCPELFSKKTVAITSFDSGPLIPNDQERSYGWYSLDDIFYAPMVLTPNNLPYEQYDEWYIFDELKEFKRVEPFVNYGSFFLRDPSYQMENIDPSWDKVGLQSQIDGQKDMQDRFWKYIEQIQPRSFVLDGGTVIFGSLFPEDIKSIKGKLAEPAG